MTTRALEIKQKTLRQHDKNLLPFLAQSIDGDQYFRLQQCSTLINVAGLKEAAEAFCGKDKPGAVEPLQFTDDIVQNILSFVHRVSRGRRQISVAMIPNEEASERLAQLDIEKYGVAKVRFSGTRDKPYYSTANRMTLVNNTPDQQDMIALRKLTKLLAGGDMTVIELGNTELKDNELVAATKQIIENEAANQFTYNRKLTYCANCKRSWFGVHHKCPSCGAIGTLTGFDQYATV
jgi:anaerobic ribonucleoside-triphosphate reductase